MIFSIVTKKYIPERLSLNSTKGIFRMVAFDADRFIFARVENMLKYNFGARLTFGRQTIIMSGPVFVK